MFGNQLDPLGYAFGSGVSQGLAGMGQQWAYNQDMGNLADWVKFNTVAQAAHNWRDQPDDFNRLPPGLTPGGPPIGMTSMPQMMSPMGKQMQSQFMGNQIQNMMGLDPLQEAQRQNYLASADRDRAYANQLRNPVAEPPSPTDLKSREMQQLDTKLRVLEMMGKQDTDEYREIKKRRDEQYGYNVSGESPTQQLSKMKLDAIRKLKPDSYEFKKAMGLSPEEPVPAGLHEDLTDALQAIQLGADPIQVYHEMFRANPQFITQAAGIRRILLAGEDPFKQFLENLPR